MKSRLIYLLTATILLAAMFMAVAGAGVGVGQDGYPVGDSTVSPGSLLCVGQTVTVSGSGAPAGATLDVAMTSTAYSMTRGSQGGYAAALGTTTADGSGNWTLTASVPSMATVTYGGNPSEPEGSSVPVRVGSTWWVQTDDHSYGGNYMSLGLLDIASCTLPSTGFPTAAAGLLGAGMLASATAGFGFVRYRLKR